MMTLQEDGTVTFTSTECWKQKRNFRTTIRIPTITGLCCSAPFRIISKIEV